jgi:aryl carrier-like protein
MLPDLLTAFTFLTSRQLIQWSKKWKQLGAETGLQESFETLPRNFLKNEFLDMVQIFMCLHQWQQYTAYTQFL